LRHALLPSLRSADHSTDLVNGKRLLKVYIEEALMKELQVGRRKTLDKPCLRIGLVRSSQILLSLRMAHNMPTQLEATIDLQ
jgi:hypothetical protein